MRPCYDFPEAVVHDPGCPRYNGGICHPMPTPVPPYAPEEEEAVKAYDDFLHGRMKNAVRIRATGATIFPAEEGRA